MAKRQTQFIANPHKFSSHLLGAIINDRLKCPSEKLESHLNPVYRDPQKGELLGNCDYLENQPPPTQCFNIKDPTWADIPGIVWKARANSAPGPSRLGSIGAEEMVCCYEDHIVEGNNTIRIEVRRSVFCSQRGGFERLGPV